MLPEPLQNYVMKERETLPYITPRTTIYVDDTNKVTKDDEHPWLDVDNKRWYIIDREII